MKLFVVLLIVVVVKAANLAAEPRALPLSRSMDEQLGPKGVSGPNPDASAGPNAEPYYQYGREGGGEEGRRQCYFCGWYNCWG